MGGGETLELAGLTLEVIFTPGHSPGHVTYAVRDEDARCSRATSCSRARSAASTSPAATGRRCFASIETLASDFPPETTVYPGHMGVTTLGRERATNPFLRELAER